MASILLFDGVCNLCNGAVRWIIPRDPHGNIHFASLQSATGQDLAAQQPSSQEENRASRHISNVSGNRF